MNRFMKTSKSIELTKRPVLRLLLICNLFILASLSAKGPTSASSSQSGSTIFDDIEVITSENAHRIELIDTWGIGNIRGMDLSPDGTTIAIVTNTGVHLFDSTDGDSVGFVDLAVAKVIPYECNFQNDNLAFSPDGQFLAIGDETIILWDLQNDMMVAEFSSPQEINEQGIVTKLRFSRDGNQLIAAWARKKQQTCFSGRGFFSIHDTKTADINYAKEFDRYVYNYEFSLSGMNHVFFQYSVTSFRSWLLNKVESATGDLLFHRLYTLDTTSFYKFDADGTSLITYFVDYSKGTSLDSSHLFSLPSGIEVATFPYFISPLPSSENLLAFDDGEWFIQTSSQKRLCKMDYLGDLDNYPFFYTWNERTTGENIIGSIDPIIFSGDGMRGISYSKQVDKIWVWDFENCTISAPVLLLPDPIWELGFDREGQSILTDNRSGGNSHYAWDLSTGIPSAMAGNFETASSCHENVISPNLQIRAENGYESLSLILLEQKTSKVLTEIDAGPYWYCLDRAFSPDGKILATLADDGVIRLWGVRK